VDPSRSSAVGFLFFFLHFFNVFFEMMAVTPCRIRPPPPQTTLAPLVRLVSKQDVWSYVPGESLGI
jgi:hypothetical protein